MGIDGFHTDNALGIAPDPATTHETFLHIYGADAWGWRGQFRYRRLNNA
jgi:hypothetical protein